MIDNQFHNDLCNDPANPNYNFDQVSPYMSMNELNKLKYNLITLSVLQLNGRSIVKNFDNLKLLLNSIHNKYDVISICEICFEEFYMNLFKLQGYFSYYKGVYTPRAQASASVLAQSGSLNVLFASHFVLDDASTLALACARGVYTTKC